MLDLMDSISLTVDRVAAKTGTKTQTIYKAIEVHTPGHEAIAFPEKGLGKGFTDIWLNNPKHPAA